ncbi:unnamed protein product [Eruca vesicaria subsp. sativa]|uniref:DUF7610 domain-containing protein n=1 Tax=Eruca vesicaria subsp. sativa TaxID=29727 RepID=A0ABC8L3Z0_ERUVS|nr:unnamed protein product [Eruca vesicaria subsp. sativa]
MTKINSVLEKKLEELENLIESLTLNEVDPKVYRDVELRVIFLKTLLAAEISSRPTDIEGEEVSEERLKLTCMAKRLKELEDAFNTIRLSGLDSNDGVVDGESNDGVVDESLDSNDGVVDVEAGSVSSWVNSCQGELGEAEVEKEEKKGDLDAEQWPLFQDASSEDKKGDEDVEQWPLFQDASWEEKEADKDAEQWPLFEDASSAEKKEITFPAAVKEEVVVRDVKEKRRFGSMDLVCLGLVGVILTLLLGYIGDISEEDPFLTPT